MGFGWDSKVSFYFIDCQSVGFMASSFFKAIYLLNDSLLM